jgi:hypothetical protein
MDPRPHSARFRSRSMMLLVLAMGAAGAACASSGQGGSGGSGGNASGSGGSGSGGSGSGGSGSGGSGSGGSGSGGSTASGGSNGAGGNTSSSGGSNSSGGNTGSGGNTSSGGNIGSGGSSASGGSNGSGGNGSGGSVSTGGNTGSGGNSSSGGTNGSGGSSATGGSNGSGGTSATGGATGTGGAAGSSGTGGTTGCPSNATFCSGFEDSSMPAGAIYMVNAGPGDWTRDFAIDTTQHHAGNSSLLVKPANASGSSGSAYRMLAVPGTPNAFWVRFWIMGANALGGDSSHNAYAGGSIGDTPNDLMIEFAEDVGIAFNTSDSDQWPTGYGRLSGGGTKPYVLPAMTWECIEISYDGTGKEQQLFINNVQLIDAKSYPANTEALTYFKFGYDGYNLQNGGSFWYDDVAVAPTRIGGCPTVAMSNM